MDKWRRIFQVVFLAFLVPLLLSQYGCEEGSIVVALERDTQQSVEELQKHLVFFQHKTSGLCFATMTKTDGYRASGYLAHVPCENIAPNLLLE